jgi:DNA-binding transcriptional regulator YdaS (Cro superfamily)
MEHLTPVDALKRAIELAGGQSSLADKLSSHVGEKISQARVWNWINRDKQAPIEFCALIEKIVDAQITRQQLRPDDFRHIWPELIGLPDAPAHAQDQATQGA